MPLGANQMSFSVFGELFHTFHSSIASAFVLNERGGYFPVRRVCHLPVRHGRSGQSWRVESPSAHGSSRALHVAVQTTARRAGISERARLWTVRAPDETSLDCCFAKRGRAASLRGMPVCTFTPPPRNEVKQVGGEKIK